MGTGDVQGVCDPTVSVKMTVRIEFPDLVTVVTAVLDYLGDKKKLAELAGDVRKSTSELQGAIPPST